MFGFVLFCVLFCFLCVFVQPCEAPAPAAVEAFDIDEIISIIDPCDLLDLRNATVSDDEPTDESLTVPVKELPVKPKLHDLRCMSAAEIRALCREKGIKCNSRGRISARVYEKLAAL